MKKILFTALSVLMLLGLCASCNPAVVEALFKIDVQSVSLSAAELSLLVGETASLSATVEPSDATNRKVLWSSSDTATVTVDGNGNVEAIAAGSATITVTTEDGGKTAVCSVTVNGGCLAKGTMITMADGSKKAVENLVRGEEVLTFDHETGLVSHAPIIDYYLYTEDSSGVMTLHFSDNFDVTVVLGHSFYSAAQNKYVQLTIANAGNFIGQQFFCLEDMSWKTLEGYTIRTETEDSYVVVTKNHLNCIANGMLTNEDDIYHTLANTFEFDENMRIIADKKAADIQKYGLWTYDDITYLTEEAFDGLNLRYFGVLEGRGIITRELIDAICANVSSFDPDIVRPEMR